MDKRDVIAAWRRASDSLRASDLMLREGLCDNAVSDAYYASYAAARAALLLHDVATKTHSGAHHMFYEHCVANGDIEPKWASLLSLLEEHRLKADYDLWQHFDAESATYEYEQARQFVGRIRQYLLEKGLTEQEIPDA